MKEYFEVVGVGGTMRASSASRAGAETVLVVDFPQKIADVPGREKADRSVA